ncbi:MAG: L,D-transpeptidase family protein [Lachnospiraceae bacterium]|nr:L,D-transpeptidase family protein [Lachnospiraceae bacterium]
MKRRIIVFLCSILTVAASVLLAVTVLSTYYYKDVFTFGTWINGNYCTGMTSRQVSDMLLEQYVYPEICVSLLDEKVYELSYQDYGVCVDYSVAVNELLTQNTGWGWLKRGNIFKSFELVPNYNYDLDTMRQKLLSNEWLNEDLYDEAKTVSIVKTLEDGYILVDETQNLLIQTKAIEKIMDSIVNQLTEVDLREDCYIDIPYNKKMLETMEKWKGIEAFQDFAFIYDFGDRKEIINKGVVCDWIMLNEQGYIVYDENNLPVLDEAMIEEYVAYLGSVYNTVGMERSFQTTRGDIVKIAGGAYGNELDLVVEFEYLKNAFINKERTVRTPEYKTEAFVKGADDIGKTYIEIDMGNQMMYYYKNGKLKLETPVVTGNMKRNWDTPATVCYVYYKQKNRVLRGANYATPVKYWMAVHGNIGIHDASWRKEFGGDIYLTDGSHGCINTPLEKVKELYDMVEIGTPVIMFY